ncbi:HD domain-containing protein [Treponema phagedenis]|uniref:bis(5'-nucleosyl)-tetraphosphatase (symmetrical) n=1 Tax=Treponema phagedenis TaxID=162 RepID=A0A0B7GVB8_TREPH|nr:bis(5'-nucleosyl)-tetraphosphatase (symmetrical) YqeK [Treponema phagedenis]EFW38715.1 hydrolase, HD family [Treponema phagedenis F0421]NVP25376.1 HD domain-containing protein [Treponema phagedenis]QEJ94869.1 HD domain-containing protein [Treponema phagedenis]QEJ97853.1 HD domain-containing protein [Treponema phagedenis]QEK00769.1 HD domain-containing protein [Treponema phagedenis]
MTKKKIKEYIEQVDAYAKKELSEHRYNHSVRVANFAGKLAKNYHCGKKTILWAKLAGFAHDICREKPADFLLKYAKKDGKPIDEFEEKNPLLLHGRAAAILLQAQFGIKKKKLLRAIRHHTFGSKKLDTLGKILFVADKIEPGRENAENLRKLIPVLSLNRLTAKVVAESIAYNTAKNKKTHPRTKKMYTQLRKFLEDEK